MTLAAPLATLCGFRALNFGYDYPQAQANGWIAAQLTAIDSLTPRQKAAATLLYQRLAERGGIAQRRSCLPDVTSATPEERLLYGPKEDGELWYRPSLARRMEVFSDVAGKLAHQAFAEDGRAPGHLLQVSCTGYEAPTAGQRLVLDKGWGQDTKLLHLGHMGCYAALPAVALAGTLAAAHQHRVSVLHVELCTLHLHLDDVTPGQVVIHHLFGDGAIRYDLLPGSQTDFGPRFELFGSFEELVPDTADAMTWRLGGHGFLMSLARRVPAALADVLPEVVGRFLKRQGLQQADLHSYAVHPGGTTVLDRVAEVLALPEAALAPSRKVLSARGNMSSATLPHIWQNLLADDAVPHGALVLSLAFGPGLTVTGHLLRKATR